MDAKYEQRKKMIYDFMCDDMYVPMKIKELARLLRSIRLHRHMKSSLRISGEQED